MSIQRVANVERAQMLMESTSRKALHKALDVFSSCCMNQSPTLRTKA